MFFIVLNALYGLSIPPKQSNEGGTVIIPILQMSKLRPRKVKELIEVTLSISSSVGI